MSCSRTQRTAFGVARTRNPVKHYTTEPLWFFFVLIEAFIAFTVVHIECSNETVRKAGTCMRLRCSHMLYMRYAQKLHEQAPRL